MAASQEQKVDFLLKKIGYVASKTGIAEDSSLSGTKKAPFGESIPSPLVTPASSVWAEAAQIPETPPGSDTSFVRVYLSGSSGHRMTVDSTVSGNRTFIAHSTYNDNTTAILGDWIDPSFSSDYIIKVFQGDPNSGGVQLSAAGSGSNDTWFFDYSSGVLNFNGTSVPSGVTSTNIYIVGYRYIGIKGVAVPGAGTTFTFATIGDFNVTGITTFFNTTDNTLGNENTGSVQLDGGMGIAKNLTVKQNLHVGGYAEFVGVATFKGGTINLGDADTDDINVGGEFISDLVPDVDDTFSLGTSSKQWKNLFINGHAELDNTVISGVSTFSSPLDINADVDIDGHTELDNVNIAGVTTFQSNAFFGDADYIQMGDSQDLKIGHVGSYSVILDQGEGNLSIGGDGFVDIMNTALDEYKARFTTNGSVELYFDNVNKFETTGYGATVFGTLQSQQLNVTGVSTYAGDADFNGNVDIDGHTELDNVNISGVTTFQSNAFFGDGDILHFGAGEDLEIYHSGSSSNIRENGTGNLNVWGDNIAFFNSAGNEFKATFTTNGSVGLYFDNANKFETTGYGATVFGTLQSQQLNVTGVSTFTGDIDANGDLDVDGHTNLDNVDIAGVTTTSGLLDINAGGQANTFKVEDLTDNRVVIAGTGGELEDDANLTFNGSTLAVGVDLDVDGHTNLDNVSVAGVTTFTGAIDANGNLDVDGTTELDVLNVAETATFSSNIDVDGHTELDNVNISGVATATAFHTGAEGSAIRVTSNTISGPAEMFIDPAGVGDNTGALRIKGDLFVDGTQTVINSTTIELGDFIVGIATTATTDSLADGAGIKIGPDNTFLYDHSNTSLKSSENLNLASSKTYKIDGTDVLSATTLGSGVVNSSLTSLGTLLGLTVSGQTTLNTLAVTGVSTFTGAIDANGDLDVDGHTNLDNVSIAGVSTFTGTIDANGLIEASAGENKIPSLYANLAALPSASTYHGMFAHVHSTGRAYFAHAGNWLELVNKNVAGNVGTGTEGYNVGIITATGIDLNGDLDVDGHTNLDNVSVAGVTTFASRIVGAATNNVIPFLYSNYGDLPNAGTYHGAFAHVHSMGKGLFAHGGAWYELVNKELNGTVGTGTERYNVGQIDATDVDVSGITTSVSLHVGVGGTVITASGIGSVGINSTTPAYALDVVGDINSSTDIKVNGVSIVSSSGASLDDVVALAIALG